MRLDVFLAKNITELTRTFIKKLINQNQVKLNGKLLNSPSTKLKNKDQITVNIIKNDEKSVEPKKMKLDVVYEAVINNYYNVKFKS